jgi:hypothetical protein
MISTNVGSILPTSPGDPVMEHPNGHPGTTTHPVGPEDSSGATEKVATSCFGAKKALGLTDQAPILEVSANI